MRIGPYTGYSTTTHEVPKHIQVSKSEKVQVTQAVTKEIRNEFIINKTKVTTLIALRTRNITSLCSRTYIYILEVSQILRDIPQL
jgi:hypothetical protein